MGTEEEDTEADSDDDPEIELDSEPQGASQEDVEAALEGIGEE